MNTVGRKGTLGESVRCVVSVSMLTEGWDTNTVTHVLGVRAFGTQLLCEQVIGRALRRYSYDLITEGEEAGYFKAEYADVLGIPFDFTAKSVPSPPQVPRQVVNVKALKERAALEITFPRVQGYRVEMPRERLDAQFNEDSVYNLTPDEVGPTDTRVEGIVGEGINIGPQHLREARYSTIVFELVSYMLKTSWRDAQIERPGPHLFMDLKRIAREWLDNYLNCVGGTQPAQILDPRLLEKATQKITSAITRKMIGQTGITAILDPYNPEGSTAHVNFNTTKTDLWKTSPARCHVNWVVLDSGWEAEFCRVAEKHPLVHSYVKNHALGFEVPYQQGANNRVYRPDFIVRVNDRDSEDDLLNLVVEIKGYRGEDMQYKRTTMETLWLRGVNLDNFTSQGESEEGSKPLQVYGREAPCPQGRHWRVVNGRERLIRALRLELYGKQVRCRIAATDQGPSSVGNVWSDVLMGSFVQQKVYVVQTAQAVIQRCILMTTDPGDLVLDPTCGSGTTALEYD